jgi:hypothetical protein
VRVLIRNTSHKPLYLFRNIGQCNSHLGKLSLNLRDRQNNDVEDWECFIDDYEFSKLDVVAVLHDSRSAILLNDGETYGREEEIDLPNDKGTFRLRAELVPLADGQMRVLLGACSSPAPSITLN